MVSLPSIQENELPETKNPEGLRLFGVLEIDVSFS